MKEEVQEINGKAVEIKIEHDNASFRGSESENYIKDQLSSMKIEYKK